MQTDEAVAVRGTGVVKWFNKRRGYGFIVSDADGTEVFAYFDQARTLRRRYLMEGQRVSFEAVEGPQGPRASRIRVIDEGDVARPAMPAAEPAPVSLRIDVHGPQGWQSAELALHRQPVPLARLAGELRILQRSCEEGPPSGSLPAADPLRGAACRVAEAMMALDTLRSRDEWARASRYLYLRIDFTMDGANVFLVPVAREQFWLVPAPLPVDPATGVATYVRWTDQRGPGAR